MPLTVSDAERDELMVTYAALILNDDGVTINADNINKLIKAAGGSVEPYWPSLFANLLQGRDVNELLLNAGAAGPSAGPAGAGGAAAGGDDAAEEAAEEEAEEEEESSSEEMGLGLFG